MATHTRRLAVLIDADNAQPSLINSLLNEVSKYGQVQARRIYGDWSKPQLNGWKKYLLSAALMPVQQISYTPGKNATDFAMTIDAMDLLYSNRFDGFCLVSSDSDFTPLAIRIRAAGLLVYGFGKQNTPQPFCAACDDFFYTDVLAKASKDKIKTQQYMQNENQKAK